MAKTTLTLDSVGGVDVFSVHATESKRSKVRKAANLLRALAGQMLPGHPVLRVGTATASGTVVCAAPAAADTVSINGVALTAGTDFSVAGDNTADAAALAAAINASVNPLIRNHVTATSSGATVTVTARVKGHAGNAITLASSNDTRLDVTGTRLTGGADTVYTF